MKKHILLIFALSIFSFNSFGQKNGEQELGAWYTLAVANKISEKVSITTMAQLRLYEPTDNLQLGLGLVGLNYHFSPVLTGTFGYFRLKIDNTFEDLVEENNINEDRIFEQLTLKNSLGKLTLNHRYRLEHRFLNFAEKPDDFQQRVRYRLQVIYPLSKNVFLNAYDEIIMNLQNKAFSQNRMSASLGYKFNKDLNVQMGYLKQSFESVSYDFLLLGVFLKTDFSRKK